MGFLDNVKDALKDAVSTQASKDAEAKKDDVVIDQADTTSADDPATPAPPTIPVDTDSADTEPAEEKARQERKEDRQEAREDAAEAKFETYTVKSGDTLSEIGARFGVSYQEIARLNSIENTDLIFPGQVFRIPKN